VYALVKGLGDMHNLLQHHSFDKTPSEKTSIDLTKQ